MVFKDRMVKTCVGLYYPACQASHSLHRCTKRTQPTWVIITKPHTQDGLTTTTSYTHSSGMWEVQGSGVGLLVTSEGPLPGS